MNSTQFGYALTIAIGLMIIIATILIRRREKRQRESNEIDPELENLIHNTSKHEYLQKTEKELDQLLKWHKNIIPKTKESERAFNMIYATRRYIRTLRMHMETHPPKQEITKELWAHWAYFAEMAASLPRVEVDLNNPETRQQINKDLKRLKDQGLITDEVYNDFRNQGQTGGMGPIPGGKLQ